MVSRACITRVQHGFRYAASHAGRLSVRSTPLHLSLLYVSLRDLTLAADGPCSWCTTARRTSRRRPLSAPRRRRALRRARARSRSDRGCLWRAPPSLRRARRVLAKGAGLSRTSPCRPPRRRRSPRQPSASALRAANAWDELARLHKDRLREGAWSSAQAVGYEWEGRREARTGALIVSSVHGRGDRYLGSCNDGPAAGGCVSRRSMPRRPRGKRNVPDHQHVGRHVLPLFLLAETARCAALVQATIPESSERKGVSKGTV